MAALRKGFVATGLALAVVAPLATAWLAGLGLFDLLRSGAAGFLAAVDSVGWVLVPQVALAIAVVGFAIHLLSCRAAGIAPPDTPSWLDPAVESALLLGMLGTISGMVSGFVGLSPDELEPGPLLHALGQALRSTLVGFSIALVGVWARARPVLGGEVVES